MPSALPNDYQLVQYRGKWALSFGKDADRKRISTGTADKGLAQAKAREIWGNLHAPPSDRVADLWNSYLADRRVDGKDIRRQENAWKKLGPVFADRVGSDIVKQDCRDYCKLREREGAARATIKLELEYLRACLNMRYGRGNGLTWLPAGSPPRDRYLTREEVDQLLAHVSTPHVRLFIILAITTGARMGAILDLKWDQVDLHHRTINFNPAGWERSNKRRAQVPINDTALSALRLALAASLSEYVIEWQGQRVRSVKTAVRKAAIRSGVTCSPHVFRHTSAVWQAQADVPIQKIAQFLGHTSSRVTEQSYARYSPSFLKDSAAALELGFT
jgi:integrase